MVALGVVASDRATRRTALPKPVVAADVLDPVLQGTPLDALGGSGRKNLAWVAYPSTMDRDLRALHDLVPFRRVAVVVHGPFVEDPLVLPSAAELGFAIDVIPVDGQPRAALAALGRSVDAVYLTTLPGMPEEAVRPLADALAERRLPSFSMLGEPEVNVGILAGSTDEDDARRRVRRTAFAVREILLGAEPSTLPVLLNPPQSRLSVNAATAEALGVALPSDLRYRAEVVGAEPGGLGLREAVAEALAANAGLAGRHGLAAEDADRAARHGGLLAPRRRDGGGPGREPGAGEGLGRHPGGADGDRRPPARPSCCSRTPPSRTSPPRGRPPAPGPPSSTRPARTSSSRSRRPGRGPTRRRAARGPPEQSGGRGGAPRGRGGAPGGGRGHGARGRPVGGRGGQREAPGARRADPAPSGRARARVAPRTPARRANPAGPGGPRPPPERVLGRGPRAPSWGRGPTFVSCPPRSPRPRSCGGCPRRPKPRRTSSERRGGRRGCRRSASPPRWTGSPSRGPTGTP